MKDSFIAHYGAKFIWPVNNKIIAIIQKIKNDEESINEIIAIAFFSVCFVIPIVESIIPTPVRAIVI